MEQHFDNQADLDILGLSFATRLLLSELDQDIMAERTLETLADFTGSPRLGLLLCDEVDSRLKAKGYWAGNAFAASQVCLGLEGGPCAAVLEAKQPELRPLALSDGLPLPGDAPAEGGAQCLTAPLVAANHRAVGLVTLEVGPGAQVERVLTQPVLIFLTVAAIGLETARLFKLAVNDGLTGLYVRRFFDLRLAEELARVRRYGGELSLLVIDIDHFKKFNDTHGHQTGDAVLKGLAVLLRREVRAEVDLVCRYGGEEFVVIMPATGAEGAMVVAERVRAAVQARPFDCGDAGPLNVTISGGVATAGQGGQLTAEELFRRADQALYQAKAGGRNRVLPWQEKAA